MLQSVTRTASRSRTSRRRKALCSDVAERIFDQVQLLPDATLRPEWRERVGNSAGKAALIELLRLRIAKALAPDPTSRTAAEARIDFWRSQQVARLCRELIEQLNVRPSEVGPERHIEASPPQPTADECAVQALERLREAHQATSSNAAVCVSKAPLARRRKRSRAFENVIADLATTFKDFWESPTSDLISRGSSTRDQPLCRFIQLSLRAFGKTETCDAISDALSRLSPSLAEAEGLS